MILRKDQITRYMRHIAIPEIRGQGQKKILDSSVALTCKDPNEAAVALYYLAAAGAGHIYCRFTDNSGWERLSEKLLDLNSDTKLHLIDNPASASSGGHFTARIISGNPGFIKEALRQILESDCSEEYPPAIAAIHHGWAGAVKTLTSRSDAEDLLYEMSKYHDYGSCNTSFGCSHNLSGSFSSLIAVIEYLKLVLSLGKPLSEALVYDLSTMEFDITVTADLLGKLLVPKIKESSFDSLSDSKALVVGCGGLGSPAAMALAASGIGTIGLVDFDKVELSNLNRQVMHTTSRIGMKKVKSAEIFLKEINPHIRLETYSARINKENAADIISSYDVIIGALDNLPARYILNDACYGLKKPLIEAGALDICGLATTIIPDRGHCYRCIFPEPENNFESPTCSDTGVLGPIPGAMGIIEAVEAIKALTGIGKPLKNRILLFDALEPDIYVATVGKNINCELCGIKKETVAH